jgi:hypothetical protein
MRRQAPERRIYFKAEWRSPMNDTLAAYFAARHFQDWREKSDRERIFVEPERPARRWLKRLFRVRRNG